MLKYLSQFWAQKQCTSLKIQRVDEIWVRGWVFNDFLRLFPSYDQKIKICSLVIKDHASTKFKPETLVLGCEFHG